MKEGLMFFSTTFIFSLILSGCVMGGSNEPDQNEFPSVITPNKKVQENFEIRFPDAKSVIWSTNSIYYVADFTMDAKSMNVWFKQDGEWKLTKTDLGRNELNQSVRNAFSSGKYSDWQVDKTSLLERDGFSDIYIVHTSKEHKYTNIYYAVNGVQIKINEKANYIDQAIEIPEEALEIVDEYFHDPMILDLWIDITYATKLSVLDDGIHKILILDEELDFLYLLTCIDEELVPDVIINRFKASIYGEYPVDDIREMMSEDDLAYLFYFDDENSKHKVATVSESKNYITILTY